MLQKNVARSLGLRAMFVFPRILCSALQNFRQGFAETGG
jgi:hypothetical protein